MENRVLVSLHHYLKGLIVWECKESKAGKILWLCMGRVKFSVRIRLPYNPQESTTRKETVKKSLPTH